MHGHPWPIEVPGQARWHSGWVDGSVCVDTALEGFQIAGLFHIGQSFCVSLDAGPLLFFCAVWVSHIRPPCYLPQPSRMPAWLRRAAGIAPAYCKVALGCGSPVDRQACRTLLSAAGEALGLPVPVRAHRGVKRPVMVSCCAGAPCPTRASFMPGPGVPRRIWRASGILVLLSICGRSICHRLGSRLP